MGAGAADAGKGRRTRYQALGANRASAHIANSVSARVELPQCRVNRLRVGARPVEQRHDVLPFERDGGALRVVLVVAPGGAVGGAGYDCGELTLKIGDLAEGLVTVEIQSRLGALRLSHLHRLSFGKTIRSAGFRPESSGIVKAL
jgi:hypothetical protein